MLRQAQHDRTFSFSPVILSEARKREIEGRTMKV